MCRFHPAPFGGEHRKLLKPRFSREIERGWRSGALVQHVPATQLTAIDYLVMALYFGVVLGIGFALRRRTRTANDFLQSGRSLPPWVTGLAFLSANLGAQEVIGMGASGAKYGIATGIHYPFPVHLTKAYADPAFPEGSFPIAEQIAKEELSLPMFPELAPDQIAQVAAAVRDFGG